jgi:hypothetical protein
VKTYPLVLVLPLAACAGEAPREDGGDSGSGITAPTASAEGTTSADDDGTAGSVTNDPSAPEEGTGLDGASDEGTVFDVGADGFCKFKDPGIYCDDTVATECGPGGSEISTDNCAPDICLPGEGCVVCLAGQNTCMGDKVMVCNDAVDPPVWEVAATCNPSAGEGCDLAMGACTTLQQVGDVVPTGEYYQFADFQQNATPFLGGYDVDSFEDKLYVLNFSNSIDVYQVELLDSDGDGQLEPNQHPDNPEEPGNIEERVLTYVETIPSFGTPSLSQSEVLALGDRVYIGGQALTENVLGVGTSVVTMPPGWLGRFAQIGYDDVHGVWYASNEGDRRVFQHCAATNTWGIAFLFPPLAGDHMDGLEVVTDPNTGTPYVYVSDMTSDFIGQYRLDPEQGWVQENLFSYAGTAGAVVEGMGFGALNHFWATAGSSVYEVGGGDLSDYTDPPG